MKGLLIKDFYMILKYCKSYIILLVLFAALSFMNEDSFFTFYPCLISGMLPTTLLSIDERSKWNEYCGSLPYSKTQIVSAKFLMGVFTQLIVFIAIGIARAIKMNISGEFILSNYLTIMAMLFVVSAISSSISMPFIFKFGVEKGRMAYYVTIGVVCGLSAFSSGIADSGMTAIPQISFNYILLLLCFVAIGIYALSWYLSIIFYKKREIV